MTAPRRIGTESSQTRSQLLDTAERLMLSEGYAAVSSRRVAKEIGVTAPLIHYYFPTLDDLFLAVFRRRAEEHLEQQAELLASEEPLRAFWKFSIDRTTSAFTIEFMALSNHRPSIRKEIARHAERFRELELAALQRAIDDGRVDLGGMSPLALLVLMGNAGRGIVMERMLKMKRGHDEAFAFVEDWLAGLTERVPRP